MHVRFVAGRKTWGSTVHLPRNRSAHCLPSKYAVPASSSPSAQVTRSLTGFSDDSSRQTLRHCLDSQGVSVEMDSQKRLNWARARGMRARARPGEADRSLDGELNAVVPVDRSITCMPSHASELRLAKCDMRCVRETLWSRWCYSRTSTTVEASLEVLMQPQGCFR